MVAPWWLLPKAKAASSRLALSGEAINRAERSRPSSAFNVASVSTAKALSINGKRLSSGCSLSCLMAAARALAATLTGNPTQVVYPAMPVTIKTPACPVCVSPVARDAEGEWTIEADGQDVKALFHNPEGDLLGFALTGQAVKERMPLTKQLPAIL